MEKIKITTLESEKYDINNFLICNDFISKHKNEIDFKNKNLRWIYKITNKITNKIYIGKTKDLKSRSRFYISEYFHDTGKKRLIWKKMKQYGINNFYMEPIDFSYDDESISIKELYWIKKYNTMNPEFGYNISYQSVITPSKINGKVRTQTAIEKMRRSKMLCSINPDKNIVYITTGLKLFGDIIQRNKDEVKSAARRAQTLNGYFSFYLTNDIFKIQKSFALERLELAKKRNDESCILIYTKFIELSKYVVSLITKNDNYLKYDVYFIHQDDNDLGFIYDDYKVFIDYYMNLIKNNKIDYIKN